MRIHKAGYALLIKLLVFIILLNGIVHLFVNVIGDAPPLVWCIVLVLSAIFYLFCVNFFRFPHREITVDDNVILAPADGKIVVIEETEESEYFQGKRLQVSVFMGLFNVHINWFPINGEVLYFKHHTGKFSAAYLPKSSTDNERTSIAIKSEQGVTILMRQIAGAVAKRIVSYAPVGEKARQNKHAGFIKFGSRVDLFLPLDTRICVELGQKTKGSQTVIGTFQ
ncbi:phosphatidylserine decarboxylase proenzyme [Bacteroidia bacterium]|nr:phosphatidylserine decarboxylase proenzyme [Bacteroidia bacterium]